MKHIKLLAVFLVGIFILSSTLPSTAAQSDDSKLIEKMLMAWFSLRVGMFGSPYFVLRFTEPEAFIAEPSTIGIEYLNQTTITIGAIYPSTGGYRSLQDENYMPDSLMVGHDFEFKLEVPDYVPEDAFIAHFSPQQLVGGDTGNLKATLIITSNIPKDATLPRNIQLRINITKYTTFGNLYLPEKDRRGIFLSLLKGNKGLPRITWFYYATFSGHPFGRLYSGKRLLEFCSYVDIVVKLDRFHLADVIPLKRVEVGPDQLTSIPIEIRNLGSHVDTFNFRVSSSKGSELIVSPPPAITLGPNEVGYTSVGVASPLTFLDPGTAHSINIEAYSIYEPEAIFNNTATVITRGIYISEMNAAYAAILFVLLLIAVAFILFRKKRIIEENLKKPEKPWTIPIEQKHLEELKKKDRNEYEKERLMMEDEYKSAMLWYNSYLQSIRQEKRKEKSKQLNSKVTKFFKKPEKKKEKSKEKEKQPKKEKKPVEKVEKTIKEEKVKETPEIVKEQYKTIQKKSEEMQQRKEKALLKIKHAQEKQKRKIKK